MIILIDNYDSFVQNLARHVRLCGFQTRVVRNDALSWQEIQHVRPDAIVISPGPYGPAETGVCRDVVRHLGGKIPILGVCLGHQVIVAAGGGRVLRATTPVHGMATCIEHDGRHEFLELPNPLHVGRYHSLCVDRASLPGCLECSAWTKDGMVMAVRHRTSLICGWQFHPESILTPLGPRLMAAFLSRAGLPIREHVCRETDYSEPSRVGFARKVTRWHTPVTF